MLCQMRPRRPTNQGLPGAKFRPACEPPGDQAGLGASRGWASSGLFITVLPNHRVHCVVCDQRRRTSLALGVNRGGSLGMVLVEVPISSAK